MQIGLYIIVGLILLYAGAEALVRGSAATALRLGISPLVVGLTVVAFGTSAPELIVSLKASLSGSGDISLGNVIGSNICNIGLILGLSALIRPLRVQLQTIRFDVPFMIVASSLLSFFLLGLRLSRIEGAVLFIVFLMFILSNMGLIAKEIQKKPVKTFQEKMSLPTGSVWKDFIRIVFGLVMLFIGADFLIRGGVAAANRLGISQAVIGLTIIALGTSLPELATSVMASYKGQNDISVGNLIGSNLFNILFILGLSSLVHPIQGQNIRVVDLLFMLGLGMLILPLMKTGYTLKRWEGALMLGVYFVYLALIMPT